jgi:alanyl-tRNA synthetase
VDLTEVICRERGLDVDMAGYEAALDEARKRSEFKGVEQAVEAVYRSALEQVPGGEVRFTGYERDADMSKVVALVRAGELVDRVSTGDAVEVVLERTPFYGESGGQIGDQGIIEAEGLRIEISDTLKPVAGSVVHRGQVVTGSLEVGQVVQLQVDVVRRERTRRNHSATHLLHWALRQVLGPQAQQKGSLVGPDRLRFDFTHGQPLTDEQVARIEELVNGAILQNAPIRTEVLTMEQARSRGATMIFEEKYGDVVRMLTIGPSTELCGGVHARATGDIGLFKITGEQGVAAGVRRLLASTGEGSLAYVHGLEAKIAEAARAAKTTPDGLAEKIARMQERQRTLEKEIEALQKKLLTGGGSGGLDSMVAQAREVSGVKVLGVRTDVTDRGALRELAEQLRDKLGDSIVLVGSESDGKAQLVATVSKGLTARFKAGDLIRPIAAQLGGSGGGRPDMAQAGGSDVAKLDEAIEAIYGVVASA